MKFILSIACLLRSRLGFSSLCSEL
uniref:Uncharacterized protein n=1 Tax=Arundo donax TaxID=35708 RepID=A0A0A8YD16_ARUDO